MPPVPPQNTAAGAAAGADAATAPAPAPEPQALQIVSVDSTGVFVLNEDAIKVITRNPKVKEMPVVVVSVAGPFRKGKSFMLNFFLRYLMHESESDWLGNEEAALSGFKWRAGAERETVGIWVWSEPFIRKNSVGKEVAVLLIDTQGTFDNRSTMKENAVIFALNALISSFHVYNISQLIQEDVLQHMHLFTQFGVLAQKNTEVTEKPFQTLMFLIRDWSNSEYSLGEEGGEQYLQKVLTANDGKKELASVRDQIRGCFQSLRCFLMPHPGFEVSEKANFDGRLRDIRPQFIEQLRKFVPLVLRSESLIQKTVCGEVVTFDGLIDYLRSYVDVFKLGGDLPEIGTVFDATARVNHLNIKRAIVDEYRRDITAKAGPGRPYMAEADLDTEHEELKAKYLAKFRNTRKLGAQHFENEFLEQLEADITKIYDEHIEMNRHKQLLSTMRTPIVLGGLAFGTHVIGMLFYLIGVSSFSVLLSYATWCCLLAIGFWFYSTYSGQFHEAAGEIDRVAKILEDAAKSVLVTYYFGEGGKILAGSSSSGGGADKTKAKKKN
eukprot:m.102632 g.102632  ORF g.102632 m.102632 type:complete len:552 (+) comp15694_c0_seq1:52-1707(+)